MSGAHESGVLRTAATRLGEIRYSVVDFELRIVRVQIPGFDGVYSFGYDELGLSVAGLSELADAERNAAAAAADLLRPEYTDPFYADPFSPWNLTGRRWAS